MNNSRHLIISAICVLFSVVAFSTSCITDDFDHELSPKEAPTGETHAEQLAKDAVYDAASDSWMLRQGDPYSLENIRSALNNLSAGTAKSDLSADILREFTLMTRAQTGLKPTHYALKVWPKTEEELSVLESDEELNVSYHPFDVAPLSKEDTELLKSAGVPTTRAAISDERKYSVTYEDGMDEYGPAEPMTLILPVLYVAWPIEKAIPAEMEYEKLYEIYQPKATNDNAGGFSAEALYALENEAIEMTVPMEPIATRAVPAPLFPKGYIRHFDSFLRRYVPMSGLKVRLTLGSSKWETYTDDDGQFLFKEQINAWANIQLCFNYNEKWHISYGGTKTVITHSLGTYYNFYNYSNGECNYGSAANLNPAVSPHWEMHRAVDFYFNRSHNVPVYGSSGNGFTIMALESTATSWLGLFTYYSNSTANIQIRNLNRTEHNYILATTLHELGHRVQWRMKNKNFSTFTNASELIKESWADYVGWELCESYYESQGWVRRVQNIPTSYYPYTYDIGEDITICAEQNWRYNYTTADDWRYSPLFVDLRDKFNQRDWYGSNPLYPNDLISDVPYDVLSRLADVSGTWATFKNTLDDYIGIYFTRTQYDSFVTAWNEYYKLH